LIGSHFAAIILATVGSQLFGIDDRLEPLAIAGILVVIAGIWLLSYDAIIKADHAMYSRQQEREQITDMPPLQSDSNTVNNIMMTAVSPLPIMNSSGSALAGYSELDDAKEKQGHGEEAKSLPASMIITGIEVDMDIQSVEQHDCVLTRNPSSPNILFSKEWFAIRKKMFTSVGYAIGVGACTATYSIVDAMGVQIVPSPLWAFLYNFISNPFLVPFLYIYYREDTIIAVQQHKRSIVMIAPCVVGAYLIILVVFSMPGVDVALVVTLREFAVLIGAFFGVVFLKERYSWIKFAAILIMLAGMVVLKFA
jgi:multidrug transporter EmrE-like cation transporter